MKPFAVVSVLALSACSSAPISRVASADASDETFPGLIESPFDFIDCTSSDGAMKFYLDSTPVDPKDVTYTMAYTGAAKIHGVHGADLGGDNYVFADSPIALVGTTPSYLKPVSFLVEAHIKPGQPSTKNFKLTVFNQATADVTANVKATYSSFQCKYELMD